MFFGVKWYDLVINPNSDQQFMNEQVTITGEKGGGSFAVTMLKSNSVQVSILLKTTFG
jgi:hypothetical protein